MLHEANRKQKISPILFLNFVLIFGKEFLNSCEAEFHIYKYLFDPELGNMLKRVIKLSLLLLIFSSAVIFGQNSVQNEEQYYFYNSSLISVKVTPPVHYYKDRDNYVKIIVVNFSGKYLYIDTNIVFGYWNNSVLFDNTPDGGGIETPLKHKRIHPGDSLKINILLDSAEIVRNIKFPLFSLHIHLGYLFDIEKYLKKNPEDKDEDTFELSSGIALMLLERKDISCGYIELHK